MNNMLYATQSEIELLAKLSSMTSDLNEILCPFIVDVKKLSR
jgi:hypothetical protein